MGGGEVWSCREWVRYMPIGVVRWRGCMSVVSGCGAAVTAVVRRCEAVSNRTGAWLPSASASAGGLHTAAYRYNLSLCLAVHQVCM